jgi:hypothetical protein
VIIGGKYGSIHDNGQSYTEREYRYALEREKPIIGFLHKEPQSLPATQIELDPAVRKKLEDFRELVGTKTCKFWTSPVDLGSVVSRSLMRLIKRHPAVGWVRGNLVPDESASQEILRLRKEVEVVEAKLADTAKAPPVGIEDLAQGDERVTLSFISQPESFLSSGNVYPFNYSISWNELFAAVSPYLIEEKIETSFRRVFGNIPSVREHLNQELREVTGSPRDLKIRYIEITAESYQTVIIQLRALGLITISNKPHDVNQIYWVLTPYGDAVMTRLRAIRRAPRKVVRGRR